MSTPIAVDIGDAARMSGVSEATLRRAIKATDPNAWPPPLPAYRIGADGSGKTIIRTVDLDAWIQSLTRA